MKSNVVVLLIVFLGIDGSRASYSAVTMENNDTHDESQSHHYLNFPSEWDFSAWATDVKFDDKDTTQPEALEHAVSIVQSPNNHDMLLDYGGNEIYLQDFGQDYPHTVSGYIHDSERSLGIYVPPLVVDFVDAFYTDTAIVNIHMTSDLHLADKEFGFLKLFFENHNIKSTIFPTMYDAHDEADDEYCHGDAHLQDCDGLCGFEMHDILLVPRIQHYNDGLTNIQFKMLPDYDTTLFGSMASFVESTFSIEWCVTKNDDIVKGRKAFKKLWDHENTKTYVKIFGKPEIQISPTCGTFGGYTLYGELVTNLEFDMAGKKKTSQ
eukprot:526874_1